MKMPPDDQVDVAIEWLNNYEGEPDDTALVACREIARWLNHQQQERTLRNAAREGGVPVATLRARLKQGGMK